MKYDDKITNYKKTTGYTFESANAPINVNPVGAGRGVRAMSGDLIKK